MAILFLILKIIGIVLLSIVGILVVAVIFLLFIPLNYSVKGWVDETNVTAALETDADVSIISTLKSGQISGTIQWLFHILGIWFCYQNEQLTYGFQILWFKKKRSNPTISPKDSDAPNQESENKQSESENKQSESGTEQETTEKPSNSASKPKKFDAIVQRLKRIKTELSDENNKKALQLIKHESFYLCKHYGPRKINGQVQFSLGDPSYTGEFLGILSIFPIIYRNDFTISPDFVTGKSYVWGNLIISGKVRVVHLVKSAFKLFFNKTIKKVIHKYL